MGRVSGAAKTALYFANKLSVRRVLPPARLKRTGDCKCNMTQLQHTASATAYTCNYNCGKPQLHQPPGRSTPLPPLPSRSCLSFADARDKRKQAFSDYNIHAPTHPRSSAQSQASRPFDRTHYYNNSMDQPCWAHREGFGAVGEMSLAVSEALPRVPPRPSFPFSVAWSLPSRHAIKLMYTAVLQGHDNSLARKTN